MDDYIFKIAEQKQNKYTFEVIVKHEKYQEYEDNAVELLSKNVKMPGFRPGKAPKDLIMSQIIDKAFNNSINKLLPDIASQILVKENLNPITHLDYSLKEFDKEKGVIFTFVIYAQPNINISELEKIVIEQKKDDVSDKEVENIINNMVKEYDKKNSDNIKENTNIISQANETKINNTNEESNTKADVSLKSVETKEENISITDEIVQKLGYPDVNTYAELKIQIKDTLTKFQQQQVDSESSIKLIEEAVKVSNFEIPEELVEDEVKKSESDFKSRLQKIKLDIDSYLKTQNTSLELLKEQWAKDAKLQISSDLLLINLAVQQKAIPTEEELDKEIQEMKDKATKAHYLKPENRDYLRTLMTRDKGLNKLKEIVYHKQL